MTTKDEALRIALEALESAKVWHSINLHKEFVGPECDKAITAIKQAQQAQEPAIDYTVLHQFADQQGISYNKLCTAVQMCLIHPVPKQAEPVNGFGKIVGTHGKVVEWPEFTEQAQYPEHPGACKTCGNTYLASRTDVYKDKRPFIYCDCCGAMADSKTWYLTHGPAPKQAEPSRPDILEKLTYHSLERDDMTLDDCLTFLRTGGWHEVHGRTEREMVLQLTELLAAAPTPPEAK